jgi:uncharacterized membrane protein
VLVDLGGYHLLIISILGIALPVIALVQIWRDLRRSTVNQVVWTVLIVAIPVLGFVGWLIDYLLGKVVAALERRNARRRPSV